MIFDMPRISPLLLIGIFIEILCFIWFFFLVSCPQLVADALNTYCLVGGYADGFLETTIKDIISKRYNVEVNGLRRVVRAGVGQKGVCHGKLFSCFF